MSFAFKRGGRGQEISTWGQRDPFRQRGPRKDPPGVHKRESGFVFLGFGLKMTPFWSWHVMWHDIPPPLYPSVTWHVHCTVILLNWLLLSRISNKQNWKSSELILQKQGTMSTAREFFLLLCPLLWSLDLDYSGLTPVWSVSFSTKIYPIDWPMYPLGTVTNDIPSIDGWST